MPRGTTSKCKAVCDSDKDGKHFFLVKLAEEVKVGFYENCKASARTDEIFVLCMACAPKKSIKNNLMINP